MSLFPTIHPKPAVKLADRAPVRIPTGAPRLVESASARRGRSRQAAWDDLLAAVQRSASARLELYKGRGGSDRIACPWTRFSSCDDECRCRGTKTVSIDFLRRHYENLVANLVRVTQPTQLRPRRTT